MGMQEKDSNLSYYNPTVDLVEATTVLLLIVGATKRYSALCE
jgi:hypothetical protein